jgi:phosphatidylinositol glycan class H protein
MLTTKRPTPTTVSFTVSTRSSPQTFAAHLTTTLSLLLRLSAAFLLLLALLHEYQTLSKSKTYALPSNLQTLLPATAPSTLRITAYALVVWLIFRKGYKSESLLVIRGLGVQTATAGSSFLWGGSTRFIAASAVQDVFIHEAFRGFEVRFYLCIVVEGEEGVVVVFPVGLESFCVVRFCGEIVMVVACGKDVWLTLNATEHTASKRDFRGGLEGSTSVFV